MSFVHDEHGRTATLVLRNQIIIEREQAPALAEGCSGEAQIGENVVDEIGGRELRIKNISDGNIPALEQPGQPADQQGFSCACVSREYCESLVTLHPGVQLGKDLLVLNRGTKKRGIGTDFEGVFL